MFSFCIDCAYLSVNRVNGIGGENSNFSSQLRAELHCASPFPYHMFISCELAQSVRIELYTFFHKNCLACYLFDEKVAQYLSYVTYSRIFCLIKSFANSVMLCCFIKK